MNYKIILHTLGWVLIIEAACMALPMLCSMLYGENYMLFFYCILLCLACGLPLVLKKPKDKELYAKEGFTIVGLAWIVMSLFGALPFYFSGAIPSFVDALFESVSGFTTTGASILTDVEVLPKGLLFWRSFTHWIGGMGVLVFLVAIIPLAGGDNLHLIKAESTGPSVGKLVPKIKNSAKWLYGIYLLLTITQVILLLLGGLNLFESLTLTFGTVGTGGFAVFNTSIASYSPYVQIVITVFMILCGIDFTIYYLIIMRRWRSIWQADEFKAYFGFIFTSILIITLNCLPLFSNIWESLRHSAFQVGSIITTTGYTTADFDLWPELSKSILVLLMFVGACAGSTGGGIKVSRILILLKSIIKQVRISTHPRSVVKLKLNGRPIAHETVRAVNVYMAAYIIVFVVCMLIISLDNFDFTTNFTAIAATLNNIGPGLAGVGPTQNFSIYSPLSTLVMSFAMLVGRLEIFPMLILISPRAWKK